MSEPTITIPITKYLKMVSADIGKVSELFIAKIYDNKIYLCDEIPDFEDREGCDFGGWHQHLPKDISKHIKIEKNTALPLSDVIKRLKDI